MLQRSNFPHGFVVVALVDETDEACTREVEAEPELKWLWEATLFEANASTVALDGLLRPKNFTVTVKVSLTPYLVVILRRHDGCLLQCVPRYLGGADARAVRSGDCSDPRGVSRVLRGVLGGCVSTAFRALQAAPGT